MEIAMQNGRYAASKYGGLATVTGTEALAQRITMKLSARRGGFAPLPEYGSRLHTLCGAVKPSERNTAARQFVAEALADEPGLEVGALEVTDNGDGTASIALTLMTSDGALNIKLRT